MDDTIAVVIQVAIYHGLRTPLVRVSIVTMVVQVYTMDYHSNYVIHGHSDKGGPWMRIIHGIYLDYHCNYVIHGYSVKGVPG